MLRSGNDFEVFGVVTLHRFDEGYSDSRCKVGVFAVGFLTASPAWVAEDVDVRRPEVEASIDTVIAVGDCIGVLGAGFGRDDGGLTVDEVGVPGGGHANSLREDSCVTVAGDSVERFAPPVIFRDIKAGNGDGVILHLRDFFFEGHAGDKVIDTLR